MKKHVSEFASAFLAVVFSILAVLRVYHCLHRNLLLEHSSLYRQYSQPHQTVRSAVHLQRQCHGFRQELPKSGAWMLTALPVVNASI